MKKTNKFFALLLSSVLALGTLAGCGGSADTIAPAVTKGNATLLDWLNGEIEALGEEQFFHEDYEATLLDTYGADYEDTLVVEGGVTAAN